jgi:capsule biosynthesis phosphatase
MFLIIPLGGLGERFKNNGYIAPKPLINVMGTPIICWLLNNLNIKDNKIKNVIIPYNNMLSNYNFEDMLKKIYPCINFTFIELCNNTKGPVETIKIALTKFNNDNDNNLEDCPIISLDGDNFYTIDILKIWNKDNMLFAFNDNIEEPIYSYMQIDNNKKIINIAEKKKISNYASTGAYGFKSWKLLKQSCEKLLDDNIKNEYYISDVVKMLIDDDHDFYSNIIDINNYTCLGTPLHVRLFCNNYPIVNAKTCSKIVNCKRICFDLDNTLVTYPSIENDYKSVKPIIKNIEYLRYLKKLGNIIIICTARRMKTHNGNVGKIIKDIGKITLDTLEEFNIPYDEIYFGKPYADFYIDDCAISTYNNLEKELGFYNCMINPREFNDVISTNSIPLLKKISKNDLSGEIYYYKFLPYQLKDLFPYFFNYDDQNKWYEMEKINGIATSKLYINQELTYEMLNNIIGSLNRIHVFEYKNEENNINFYDNYVNKLKQRYASYNYDVFDKSFELYNLLIDKLTIYEQCNRANISMIHGDFVLTNVLINNYNKIKLIDVRGKIGNTLTIYGDKLYDYAKLYQSLIGYDEILNDIILSPKYKQNILNHFKCIFIAKFNNDYWKDLQYITASLLFTLIPLHNNDKCIKYYNLIKSIITY